MIPLIQRSRNDKSIEMKTDQLLPGVKEGAEVGGVWEVSGCGYKG